MTTLRTVKNFLVFMIPFTFALWLIIGAPSITGLLNAIGIDTTLISEIELVHEWYWQDFYGYCGERWYDGTTNETQQDCANQRMLNRVDFGEDEGGYAIRIILALGIERENAEIILDALYNEFCNTDAYYGMG